MKKKLLAILPILCVLLCIFALGASAATTISTADQLLNLMNSTDATTLNGDYVLGASIDMSGKSDQSPIGEKGHPFTGTFVGDGKKTISGLKIEGTAEGTALFGYTNGAKISNLIVSGNVTSSHAHTGGIVGLARGTTISGCTNKVNVTSTYTGNDSGVGGIVGLVYADAANSATSISGCSNSGNITAVRYVGGIVGVSRSGSDVAGYSISITGCNNSGEIKTTSANVAGGIAGYLKSSNTVTNKCKITVSDCINEGKVTTVGTHAAGIAGGVVEAAGTYNIDVTLTGNTNKGVVKSGSGARGSICAEIKSPLAGNTVTINNNKDLCEDSTSAPSMFYTFTGTAVQFAVSNSYNKAGKYIVGTSTKPVGSATVGSVSVALSNCLIAKHITTPDEILIIMNDGSIWDWDFVLKNTVDLSTATNIATYPQSPIGTARASCFTGTFDGGGYTISNLAIDRGTSNGAALFGYTKGATIENLTVSGTSTGASYCSGIVGVSCGSLTMRNCVNKVEVTSSSGNTGGVFGGTYNTSTEKITILIENCTNSGQICTDATSMATASRVGGVVGSCDLNDPLTIKGSTAQIINCKNTVAVGGKQGVGGIVGTAITSTNGDGITISGCTNEGTVTATTSHSYLGGIVGLCRMGTSTVAGGSLVITKCYNSGNITGLTRLGGILGYTQYGSASTPLKISLCENSGTIYANHASSGWDDAGGIVGIAQYTVISDCCNRGTVKGSTTGTTACLGGIVGRTGETNTITRCYSEGVLAGSATTTSGRRGILGQGSGTLTYSANYYSSDAPEYAVDGTNKVGTKVSAENIGKASSFSGLNTNNAWVFTHKGPELLIFLVMDNEIGSAEEWEQIAKAKAWNNWTTLYLCANIDISDLAADYQYMGYDDDNGAESFGKTFDGQGYSITVNATANQDCWGLFDRVLGATIKDLTVKGTINSDGYSYVGGIVGRAKGKTTITNCHSQVNITSTAGAVGGIVGQLYTADTNTPNLTIENCTNTGNVTGSRYVGGMLGYVFGSEYTAETSKATTLKISGCENSGAITATGGTYEGNCAAGILGYYDNRSVEETLDKVTICKCINTGKITASGNFAAGIVGAMFAKNNMNNANVQLYVLMNDNDSQIYASGTRASILGYIRPVASGVIEIRDVHDKTSVLVQKYDKDKGGWEYSDDNVSNLNHYVDGESGHYTTFDYDSKEWSPVWDNTFSIVGTFENAGGTLTIERAIGEMATNIVQSANKNGINYTACAYGQEDHAYSSRAYHYQNVIFSDRNVNKDEGGRWVMTWEGPMLKMFAEKYYEDAIIPSSMLVYGTASEKSDAGISHTNETAVLTISTSEHLLKLMNCHRLWDLDIVLANDIDLTNQGTGYTGLKQAPIGRSVEKKFSGTFDGQEHAIKGVHIDYTESHGAGFFGTTEGRPQTISADGYGYYGNKVERIPVIIKNLTIGAEGDGSIIHNVDANNGSRAAGIVGQVLAPLEVTNCINYATVETTYGAGGGIIGAYAAYNGSYVKVEGCKNYGTINSKAYSAGIVGYMIVAGEDLTVRTVTDNLTINNCHNYGVINGTSLGCGGVLGTVAINAEYTTDASGKVTSYTAGTVSVTNCTNNASVTGYQYCGGIFGYIQKRSDCNPIGYTYTISNCTNNEAGVVKTTKGSGAGGILGFAAIVSDCTLNVDSCENYADITGYGRAAGIVAYIHNWTTEEKEVEDAETGSGDITDDTGSDGNESGSTGGAVTTETIINHVSNAQYNITNCTNYGDVTVTNNNVAAGILGYYANKALPDIYRNGGVALNSLTITKCANYGDIDASGANVPSAGGYAGGIAGALGADINYTVYSNITISDVYNAGQVSATKFAGSVFGCLRPLAYATSYTYTDANGASQTIELTGITQGTYTLTDLHGGEACDKALIGAFGTSTSAKPTTFTVTRAFAENSDKYVEHFNPDNTLTVVDSVCDINNALQLREFVEAHDTWVNTKSGPMLKDFAKDTLTGWTCNVTSADNLLEVMNNRGYWAFDITLTKDVTLSGTQSSIGNADLGFMGSFNGGGHTISGLNISGDNSVGLFGYVEGYNTGTNGAYEGAYIHDLTVSGTVKGTYADNTTDYGVGGIIGKARGVKLVNCTNNVNASSVNTVGGVIGLCNVGSATYYTNPVSFTSSTTTSNYTVGTTTYVEKCTNNGAITASKIYAGGIAGLIWGNAPGLTASFIDNYNNGAITANEQAGGLVGRFDNYNTGANNSFTIEKFKNTGDITVVNGFAGGMAGMLTTGESGKTTAGVKIKVDTILNTANIKSTGEDGRYVGGIAGLTRNYDADAIEYYNLMNTGDIYSACIYTEENKNADGHYGGAVGGIFGAANHGQKKFIARNLYNAGSVTTKTSQNLGPISAAWGTDQWADYTDYIADLYYLDQNETYSNAALASKVNPQKVHFAQSYTQNAGANYYIDGLAPFEANYPKQATLPETYNDWIMTTEGAELTYYHVHDTSIKNEEMGYYVCICGYTNCKHDVPESFTVEGTTYNTTLNNWVDDLNYNDEATFSYVCGLCGTKHVAYSTEEPEIWVKKTGGNEGENTNLGYKDGKSVKHVQVAVHKMLTTGGKVVLKGYDIDNMLQLPDYTGLAAKGRYITFTSQLVSNGVTTDNGFKVLGEARAFHLNGPTKFEAIAFDGADVNEYDKTGVTAEDDGSLYYHTLVIVANWNDLIMGDRIKGRGGMYIVAGNNIDKELTETTVNDRTGKPVQNITLNRIYSMDIWDNLTDNGKVTDAEGNVVSTGTLLAPAKAIYNKVILGDRLLESVTTEYTTKNAKINFVSNEATFGDVFLGTTSDLATNGFMEGVEITATFGGATNDPYINYIRVGNENCRDHQGGTSGGAYLDKLVLNFNDRAYVIGAVGIRNVKDLTVNISNGDTDRKEDTITETANGSSFDINPKFKTKFQIGATEAFKTMLGDAKATATVTYGTHSFAYHVGNPAYKNEDGIYVLDENYVPKASDEFYNLVVVDTDAYAFADNMNMECEFDDWADTNDNATHYHSCTTCARKQFEAHKWDGGVVTVNPVYENGNITAGVLTYTCDKGCKDNHSINYVADKKTKPSLRVTLLSEYVLEYVIPIGDKTSAWIDFVMTDVSGTRNEEALGVKPVTFETSGLSASEFAGQYKEAGTKYFFKVPAIAAKEMGDKVSGTIYYTREIDGKQVPYQCVTRNYNLLNYYVAAMATYKNDTAATSVALVDLLNAMFTYGAAAQEYFGYNNGKVDVTGETVDKGKLVTEYIKNIEGYETVNVSGVTADNNAKKANEDGKAFSFVSQSAILDQRITTVLYFSHADIANVKAENLTFKGGFMNVTGAWVAIEAKAQKADVNGETLIAVYVDRPAAKDLRVEFTGALYDGDTKVSGDITTDFESYAATVLGGTYDEKLKNVCKAVLAYSDAAKTYFNALFPEDTTENN